MYDHDSMAYDILKFLHVTGVVMLLGNITATAIWKFFADRTGEARIIAFAQRLVTITEWSLTFWGVVLTIIGLKMQGKDMAKAGNG